MSVVFINSSGETFTPTQSGAVCTWIWEVCQAALRAGSEPWVITRRGGAAAYPWARTIFTEYPPAPANHRLHRILHTWQRACGWAATNQRAYFARVAAAIAGAGLERFPLVLQNDLELAVYLRRVFPKAFLLHHAQNNNDSTWRFRAAFGRAVDAASAVSDYCAAWNAKNFRRSVATLLSGVNADRFAPAAVSPGGPLVINFVGRTDYPKAPDLLLRAAARIAGRVPAFALQILGRNFYDHAVEDDYQRELCRLADELRARGIAVRMPGWITREALPSELRRAHLHVVPARWDEPFGLTTLEGMSCGLATVASRTGRHAGSHGRRGAAF